MVHLPCSDFLVWIHVKEQIRRGNSLLVSSIEKNVLVLDAEKIFWGRFKRLLNLASSGTVLRSYANDGTSNSPSTPHLSTPLPHSSSADELTNATRAHRFLLCWVAAYIVFFSAAATKLPHYIFPIYPAMAILTARFLIGWRTSRITVPRWLMSGNCRMAPCSLLVGVVYIGCVIVGDLYFRGVGVWAAMGLIPLAGALGDGKVLVVCLEPIVVA